MTPIRSEDPIGAIGAYWRSHHVATPDELEVLQALGDSAAMAIANSQLIERLQEADRRKDEFLAMLAHELRNPLAPLRNALHVLRLRRPEGDDAAGERARDDDRAPGRSTWPGWWTTCWTCRGSAAARSRCARERLDLARLVRQAVEDRRGRARRRPAWSSTSTLPGDRVWVEGDPTRLAQVARQPARERRQVHRPRRPGRPCGRRPSGQAVVTVRDTGIGIEPGGAARAVRGLRPGGPAWTAARGASAWAWPWSRGWWSCTAARSRRRATGPGRGASSPSGCRARRSRRRWPKARGRRRRSSTRLRILVVEDNADAAESLRLFLELYGYEVTLAHTGPDGVEAARPCGRTWSCATSASPGWTASQVASALRRTPETAGVRLIAVTGYGQEEDRRRALEAGFDDHLVKPVDPQKLLGYLN